MLCDDCLHADICESTTQGNCDWYLSEKELKEKWIPVSERLPDISERCIVQFTDGYIATSSYRGIDDWLCKERSVKYSFPTKCIIAWQPSPEPYKKEADNEL